MSMQDPIADMLTRIPQRSAAAKGFRCYAFFQAESGLP